MAAKIDHFLQLASAALENSSDLTLKDKIRKIWLMARIPPKNRKLKGRLKNNSDNIFFVCDGAVADDRRPEGSNMNS